MVNALSHPTFNRIVKSYLPQNTQVANGFYQMLRDRLDDRLSSTLEGAKTLAIYAHDAKKESFTPTDVAVVDYLSGMQSREDLQLRLMHDRVYNNFFERTRRPRGKAIPKQVHGKAAETQIAQEDDFGGGDNWDADDQPAKSVPKQPTKRGSRESAISVPKRASGDRARSVSKQPAKRASGDGATSVLKRAVKSVVKVRQPPLKRARKSVVGPATPPRLNPVRKTAKPVWMQDYVDSASIDLRKIKRDYVKVSIPRTCNNLFNAVRTATGETKTIQELRDQCATLASRENRFRPMYLQHMSEDVLKEHIRALRKKERGGELELRVLAFVTKHTLYVKNGNVLKKFEPQVFPDMAGPSKQVQPRQAVLEVRSFYDVLRPKFNA